MAIEQPSTTMRGDKRVCLACECEVEVVSDHTGNTLMHVRTTWDHQRQTSVGCFAEPLAEAPLSDREQDEKIRALEKAVAGLTWQVSLLQDKAY